MQKKAEKNNNTGGMGLLKRIETSFLAGNGENTGKTGEAGAIEDRDGVPYIKNEILQPGRGENLDPKFRDLVDSVIN